MKRAINARSRMRLATLRPAPWTSTPEELAQFIPTEIETWAQMVKDAGIAPE
jgi:tripartite-type tricarboxylate transporter receptor subunit TctC